MFFDPSLVIQASCDDFLICPIKTFKTNRRKSKRVRGKENTFKCQMTDVFKSRKNHFFLRLLMCCSHLAFLAQISRSGKLHFKGHLHPAALFQQIRYMQIQFFKCGRKIIKLVQCFLHCLSFDQKLSWNSHVKNNFRDTFLIQIDIKLHQVV